MSTTYIPDATRAVAPVRRASSPLEPRTAESSQRITRTFAKIFLISAAAVIVVSVLLAIRMENPSPKDRGCIFSANPHHSLVHPYVSPLSLSSLSSERARHIDDLPLLREPTGTDWIATSNCDDGP